MEFNIESDFLKPLERLVERGSIEEGGGDEYESYIPLLDDVLVRLRGVGRGRCGI